MTTKSIWANLGVSDLERTSKFYSELGFKPNSTHNSKELTSFFFGMDNFTIHFFIADKFNADNNGKMPDLNQGSEVVFSLSAENKDEVDTWVKKVKEVGGKIFQEPTAFEIGYFFGFTDPDGHKFNVLHWPI